MSIQTPESELSADERLLVLENAAKVAKEKWLEAWEVFKEAEDKSDEMWGVWNAADIALFSAKNPDIAAEVTEVKAAKQVLQNREYALRATIRDRGLKLPRLFLD